MKITFQLLDPHNVFRNWRLRRGAFTAETQRHRGTQRLISYSYLCSPLRLRASAVSDRSEAAHVGNIPFQIY